MKIINDQNLLNNKLQEYHIHDFFDSKDLEFLLVSFEAGDDINHIMNPKDFLIFHLDGTIRISHLHHDGSEYEVTRNNTFTVLGDMEFSGANVMQYRIEACTNVTAIVLPLITYHDKLNNDCRFLRYLLNSVVSKMDSSTRPLSEPIDLREKVIFFMENEWNHRIDHVTNASQALGCSRRQLQRILISLQEDNIIIKTGKGKYRIQRYPFSYDNY